MQSPFLYSRTILYSSHHSSTQPPLSRTSRRLSSRVVPNILLSALYWVYCPSTPPMPIGCAGTTTFSTVPDPRSSVKPSACITLSQTTTCSSPLHAGLCRPTTPYTRHASRPCACWDGPCPVDAPPAAIRCYVINRTATRTQHITGCTRGLTDSCTDRQLMSPGSRELLVSLSEWPALAKQWQI